MVWLASTKLIRLSSFLLLWAAPKLTMAQTELYMTNMAYHVLGNLAQYDYLYVYYYACAYVPLKARRIMHALLHPANISALFIGGLLITMPMAKSITEGTGN